MSRPSGRWCHDGVVELDVDPFALDVLADPLPLGTGSVLACLEAVGRVRRPATRVHLLGLARPEWAPAPAAAAPAPAATGA